MRVCVLGPLRVEVDGRGFAPGGPRQRAVFVHLYLHANQAVPGERLVEEVWGSDDLAAAANTVQATVSRLRRQLPEGRLRTTPQGYLLQLADDETDAGQFLAAVESARWALAEGKAAHAASLLREGLDLWRGPALQDARFAPFAQAEVARLDELRLVGLETLIEAELTRGAGRELVPELRRLTGTHPLRESLRGHLMVALYRAGRQAEALEVHRDLRAVLATELGVDPSPALTGLHEAVLRQEPWLDHALAPPAPASAAAPGQASGAVASAARRPVTVVHLDVGTSSPGDPEAQLAVRRRVLETVEPVVVRHGGRVVQASAREVVAAFGVRVVHEDDAVRACRAASEALAAMAGRPGGPAVRAGVASADALVDAGQPGGFVSAATDLARSIATSAPPGGVVVDLCTHDLSVSALTVEPFAHEVFSLVAVGPAGRPMPALADSPLVDRTAERAVLDQLLGAVVGQRSPRLVTLVGEAGRGKTRLAQEIVRGAAGTVTVLVGRCPPYGEGVTFSPLREVVTTICGGEPTRERIVEVCRAGPDAGRDAGLVADRLLAALGRADPGAADVPEILWATRHLLTAVAGQRPTVLMLDDIGWALPALLDLVESLVDQLRDVPLLVVCTARPELLEDRPGWPGAAPSGRSAERASVLELGPLPAADTERLADVLAGGVPLGPRLRVRLARASGGNPLFLEQLVAAARDRAVSPGADLPLPATVQALLAARLDRLGPAELTVVTTAAVLGNDCAAADLAALLPREVASFLPAHLRVLAGKALLATAGATVSFPHALVREAAYRVLPKGDRARLHEAAALLAERPGSGVRTVGHHLARAASHRFELGDLEAAEPLARRAVEALTGEADALLAVGDADAAARSHELAAGLLARSDPDRPQLLTAFGGALFECGRLAEANDVLVEAVEAAAATGDARQLARAEVELLHVTLHLDPQAAATRIDARVDGFAEVFAGDDASLARTELLRAAVHWNRARSAPAEQAWHRAGEHAARAGDVRRLVQSRYWLASAALWGPTQADEGVERCRRWLAEAGASPTGRAIVGLHLAGLLAMTDDVDGATRLLAESSATLAEVGSGLPTALTEPVAFVHGLIGDRAEAERLLRAAYEDLTAMGERASLATCAAVLARTLVVQGPHRHLEAEQLVAQSWAAGGDHDVSALVIGRSVIGRVLAARGEHEAARTSARAAVELAAGTDFTDQTADAHVDLADVLFVSGDLPGARAALSTARDLHAAKGNRPGVRACERLLAEITTL